MTTTREPAVAPAPALTPDRLAVLGAVFADAISHREPSPDGCTDCDEDTGALCADHEADLDQATSYAELARELGIEEQ